MEIHWQFFRYAIVGLTSNVVLYIGYLLLTWAEMGHKTAMTLLYTVGVLMSFVFNKRWSFRYENPGKPALLRYATVYTFGYMVNLLALFILVDYAGFPHQIVQGIMVIIIACAIFLLQKYWVFQQDPKLEI